MTTPDDPRSDTVRALHAQLTESGYGEFAELLFGPHGSHAERARAAIRARAAADHAHRSGTAARDPIGSVRVGVAHPDLVLVKVRLDGSRTLTGRPGDRWVVVAVPPGGDVLAGAWLTNADATRGTRYVITLAEVLS